MSFETPRRQSLLCRGAQNWNEGKIDPFSELRHPRRSLGVHKEHSEFVLELYAVSRSPTVTSGAAPSAIALRGRFPFRKVSVRRSART